MGRFSAASLGSTEPHTPGLDYRATSERIGYQDLPEDVRETIAEVVGCGVAQASPPVTSGFTRAYAGQVRLANGRRVFVKATGPDLEIPLKALRREAEVLAAAGDLLPAVPMVHHATCPGGGAVLVLRYVDGHLPGYPWSDEDVTLVREACEQVASVPAAEVAELAPGRLATDLIDAQLRATLAEGLKLPEDFTGLPAWLPRRHDQVIELARGAERLVGDHVNHFDLRPDNIIIGRLDGAGPRRAYFLDWNWFTLGPGWCDWAGLLPGMRDQGRDLRGLLDRASVCDRADDDALKAWFAVLAVFMLQNLHKKPLPGTTMALRRHQRYYARTFLETLGDLSGWPEVARTR